MKLVHSALVRSDHLWVSVSATWWFDGYLRCRATTMCSFWFL